MTVNVGVLLLLDFGALPPGHFPLYINDNLPKRNGNVTSKGPIYKLIYNAMEVTVYHLIEKHLNIWSISHLKPGEVAQSVFFSVCDENHCVR